MMKKNCRFALHFRIPIHLPQKQLGSYQKESSLLGAQEDDILSLRGLQYLVAAKLESLWTTSTASRWRGATVRATRFFLGTSFGDFLSFRHLLRKPSSC